MKHMRKSEIITETEDHFRKYVPLVLRLQEDTAYVKKFKIKCLKDREHQNENKMKLRQAKTLDNIHIP